MTSLFDRYARLLGYAFFVATILITLFVVFRAHLTFLDSWWITISTKKYVAIALLQFGFFSALLLLKSNRSLLFIAVGLMGLTLYSGFSDFHTRRSDGNYDSSGHTFIYKNNSRLGDEGHLRSIKASAANIRALWEEICATSMHGCAVERGNELGMVEEAMFVVSAFFDYGNSLGNASRVGCAGNSEETDFQQVPYSFALMQRSTIGCCNDYAYALASFLNYLNIENELVFIPGHIANRVRIGGEWIYVDANTNLIVEGLFEDKAPMTFRIYPHPNVSPQIGRATIFNFQRQLISRFQDRIHFILNYVTFQKSSNVNELYFH